MSRKSVQVVVIEENLPSDYNSETDGEENLDEPADITVVVDVDPEEDVAVLDESDRDEDKDQLGKKRKWSKRVTSFEHSFQPYSQSYSSCSVMQAFFQFFDESLMKKIHYETNLKSVQMGKPASISIEEIQVFLGINIMMGYHRLPSLRHYWCLSDDLGVPPIMRAMSRTRFETILRFLHLNDNAKMETTIRDKLYKVRPLVEHLNKLFSQLRKPQEFLSIDESMILFKGRSSLKQYNPMKPIKRGYKIWCMADNDGYIHKF